MIALDGAWPRTKRTVEVSLDDFVRRVSLAEPRAYQRWSDEWLSALLALPDSPRLQVGPCSLSIFDSLRSEILLRVGNALRNAEILARVRDAYPNAKIRLTGHSASSDLVRLGRFTLGPSVVVGSAQVVERARQLAWIGRSWLRHTVEVPKPLPPGCHLLAFPRRSSHLADIKPVVAKLAELGVVTGFAAPYLLDALQEAGFPHTVFGGAGMRSALARAPSVARSCMRAARSVSVPNVSPQVAVWALRDVLTANLLELLWFAFSADALLRNASPRLVLPSNPYTMEGRVAAQLARAHGIPSAALEHGTIFANDPIWADCPVDRVLVWGEPSRRALISCGVDDSRISVVGAPRLDGFINARDVDAGQRVLVATSGPGDQVGLDAHLRFVEVLMEAAAGLPEVEFVIKLHPKDSKEPYLDAQKRFPGARVAVVRGDRSQEGLDIYKFLAESKVLVTVTSTAALDAMAVGVPVISVLHAPLEHFAHIEFLARGCTTNVGNAAELGAALREALDGRSSPSVADAAQSYANEQYHRRGDAAALAAQELMRAAKLEAKHA